MRYLHIAIIASQISCLIVSNSVYKWTIVVVVYISLTILAVASRRCLSMYVRKQGQLLSATYHIVHPICPLAKLQYADIQHFIKRKYVTSSECRHDTRPSIYLSHVDSKLGLTMVTPSLQSAPTCKRSPDMWRFLWCPSTSSDPDNWNWHSSLGNLYTNLDFLRCFCFWVTSLYGTDRETDGRSRRIMQPTGRPHGNSDWSSQNNKIKPAKRCSVWRQFDVSVRDCMTQITHS